MGGKSKKNKFNKRTLPKNGFGGSAEYTGLSGGPFRQVEADGKTERFNYSYKSPKPINCKVKKWTKYSNKDGLVEKIDPKFWPDDAHNRFMEMYVKEHHFTNDMEIIRKMGTPNSPIKGWEKVRLERYRQSNSNQTNVQSTNQNELNSENNSSESYHQQMGESKTERPLSYSPSENERLKKLVAEKDAIIAEKNAIIAEKNAIIEMYRRSKNTEN